MDEDYNLPDEQQGPAYPGQALTQTAQDAIPEPWSPADDQHLMKLNNAAAHAREEFGQGNIDQGSFDGLLQQINRVRAPMLQRQQSAKSQAQQEQVQSAMHQNALATGMQLQDQQAGTAAFKMATDPETGAKFVPDGWSPYEAPEAVAADEAPGESNDSVPQTDVRANPDGTHQLTIMNGSQRSEVTYGPDGQGGMRVVGQQHFDANGQPLQPREPSAAAGNADGSLSDQQRQEIQMKATRLVGQPPPQFWNGRPNPQYGEWMKRVQSTSGRMEQEQISLNLARTKGQITTAENQRREGVQAAKASAKQPVGLGALGKTVGFTPHDVYDMLKKEEEAIAKSEEPVGGGRVFSDGSGKKAATTPTTTWQMMPRGEIHKEAERRLRERMSRLSEENHPDVTNEEPGGSAPTPAEAVQANAPPPPPPIKPLPKGAATEADIDAAIARKLREKQGPGVAQTILQTKREPGFRQ